MRRLAAAALLGLSLALPARAQAPDWIIAIQEPRLESGGSFDLVVLAPPGEELPDRLDVRMSAAPGDERVIPLEAVGPVLAGQRPYAGTVPAGMSGHVSVQLAGRSSSVVVFLVAPPRGEVLDALTARRLADAEPPLSQNDPMYFIVGGRGGYTARFQLSFKYRLFDQSTGVGRDQPWLAGFYFGYTQASVWDLSSESRPFRDTSYRPSLFWKWERTDDRTWIDALRVGFEHESNGGGGLRSRSVDTLFLRPEWHWKLAEDERLEFTPKFYGYLDKRENPDINRFRGHTDWRLRYDTGLNWIATGVVRAGTSGKGSLLLDLSRRIRDLRFGPVGGYLHVQYFNGYGEDILDYNAKRKAQLRIGFAIVP